MRVQLSLPEDLVSWMDSARESRGLTRSAYVEDLLRAEQIKGRVEAYLERYGWDVAGNEAAWRQHQAERMGQEYSNDEW